MSVNTESIEAAARALHEFNPTFAQDKWDATELDYRSWRREQATAALTAAAPLIAAEAVRAELMEVASLLEPFSGIGLANGATRNDVANWVRARALAIEGEAE